MSLRNKVLIGLILLSLVDVILPVPILGLLLLHVTLQRPAWFVRLAGRIYGSDSL